MSGNIVMLFPQKNFTKVHEDFIAKAGDLSKGKGYTLDKSIKGLDTKGFVKKIFWLLTMQGKPTKQRLTLKISKGKDFKNEDGSRHVKVSVKFGKAEEVKTQEKIKGYALISSSDKGSAKIFTHIFKGDKRLFADPRIRENESYNAFKSKQELENRNRKVKIDSAKFKIDEQASALQNATDRKNELIEEIKELTTQAGATLPNAQKEALEKARNESGITKLHQQIKTLEETTLPAKNKLLEKTNKEIEDLNVEIKNLEQQLKNLKAPVDPKELLKGIQTKIDNKKLDDVKKKETVASKNVEDLNEKISELQKSQKDAVKKLSDKHNLKRQEINKEKLSTPKKKAKKKPLTEEMTKLKNEQKLELKKLTDKLPGLQEIEKQAKENTLNVGKEIEVLKKQAEKLKTQFEEKTKVFNEEKLKIENLIKSKKELVTNKTNASMPLNTTIEKLDKQLIEDKKKLKIAQNNLKLELNEINTSYNTKIKKITEETLPPLKKEHLEVTDKETKLGEKVEELKNNLKSLPKPDTDKLKKAKIQYKNALKKIKEKNNKELSEKLIQQVRKNTITTSRILDFMKTKKFIFGAIAGAFVLACFLSASFGAAVTAFFHKIPGATTALNKVKSGYNTTKDWVVGKYNALRA